MSSNHNGMTLKSNNKDLWETQECVELNKMLKDNERLKRETKIETREYFVMKESDDTAHLNLKDLNSKNNIEKGMHGWKCPLNRKNDLRAISWIPGSRLGTRWEKLSLKGMEGRN